MASKSICSIEGCGKPVNGRGWCATHNKRWRIHGHPLGGRTPNGQSLQYFEDVVLAYDGDECLTWPFGLDSKGYGRVWFEGRYHIVSRLLCERAHGPAPTPEHHAAHSCGKGKSACVTKRHVGWKTPLENEADKLIHGTLPRGERQGSSKLTEVDVRNILALKGVKTQREIAGLFDVRRQQISKIHNGQRWAHIT